MGSVKGQIVVVTGGSGNLGRATAQAFAENGATLALIDINAERVEKAASDLPGSGHAAFVGDLSTKDGVAKVMDEILKKFSRVDSLVHTVGGYAAGDPVHEADIEVLDKMMALNVRPLFLVGGAIASHMLERGGGGSMVFVLAKAGQKGSKNHGAYTASKAAATRIMESMAIELRGQGIRVNGISPSTIDTPANRSAMPDADPSQWVTPQQLAEACVFLSGGDTGIYGTNLEVFGRGG